jgi:hypothetical protein
MLLFLLTQALASACLDKAYKGACEGLLKDCTNDPVCAYDMFVETASFALAEVPKGGKFIKEGRPDFVFFANEVGRKAYACLKQACPDELPEEVDLATFKNRTSKE